MKDLYNENCKTLMKIIEVKRKKRYFEPIGRVCSVTKSCSTICDPVDCSTPGFPVLYLLEFSQTHVH